MHVADVVRFLEQHEAALRPLQRVARLSSWDASTTGTEAAAQRAARALAELRKLYADAAAFAQVRAWLVGDPPLEPLLQRQLVLLEHRYLANQLPPDFIDELEERAQAIERIFYTHRSELGGRVVTDNDMRQLLEQEPDSPRRREAWEASKAIGLQVAGPLRELALRRNSAARMLGFADYYVLQLALQEVRREDLERIAEEVKQLTDPPFTARKAELDGALARHFGIAAAELRPWHYGDPFFQEPPALADVDLDAHFRGRDVVGIARRYYASIGLPADEVLARSDLYERPGKDQHAFCLDVDREGDIRVLCNLRDDARWMETLLHELGHAVFDLYLPRSLPFLLREPAHTLATEAVAMYFGALGRSVEWLRHAVTLDERQQEWLAAELPHSRAGHLLIFTRWALVMMRFERDFYRNPRRQDLNRLWWECAAELQQLAPPPQLEAREDWATKIHLAVAPVYYHNYLLGEIFAAQLAATVARQQLCGAALGEFFRAHVFRHGAALRWYELVRLSTGEPLSAHHFARALAV